mmetsp:Transcript_105730/g.210086  ORF Transcript_105730/g.210086 Transcript_105730/m.210086 type:complete len:237 (-) Transcript_105730:151-861(-)
MMNFRMNAGNAGIVVNFVVVDVVRSVDLNTWTSPLTLVTTGGNNTAASEENLPRNPCKLRFWNWKLPWTHWRKKCHGWEFQQCHGWECPLPRQEQRPWQRTSTMTLTTQTSIVIGGMTLTWTDAHHCVVPVGRRRLFGKQRHFATKGWTGRVAWTKQKCGVFCSRNSAWLSKHPGSKNRLQNGMPRGNLLHLALQANISSRFGLRGAAQSIYFKRDLLSIWIMTTANGSAATQPWA